MIEKLIENSNRRSGLKIASSKEKSPKPLETLRILDLVPVTGLDQMKELPPSSRQQADAHRASALNRFSSCGITNKKEEA